MRFRKTERVFIISIRKDVDNGLFNFPTPIPLKKCLGDLLEDEVDPKYYVSQKTLERIQTSPFYKKHNMIHSRGGICSTLLMRDYKEPKCVKVNYE